MSYEDCWCVKDYSIEAREAKIKRLVERVAQLEHERDAFKAGYEKAVAALLKRAYGIDLVPLVEADE